MDVSLQNISSRTGSKGPDDCRVARIVVKNDDPRVRELTPNFADGLDSNSRLASPHPLGLRLVDATETFRWLLLRRPPLPLRSMSTSALTSAAIPSRSKGWSSTVSIRINLESLLMISSCEKT